MSKIDFVIVAQMLVYWLFAPLLAILTGLCDYSVVSLIPYILFLLGYLVLIKKVPINDVGSTFIKGFDCYKVLIIVFSLLFTMLFVDGLGRYAFGDAQARNASFSFAKALLFKLYEIGFPLLFVISLVQTGFGIKAHVIRLLCIFGSFIYHGPSKYVPFTYAILYFVFSNFTAVRLKSLILLTLVIGMVSETVFIIRDEQSSVIEKFEYLTERLDGVKLVSEDKNNHIRLFGGDPIYSTVSSSLSVTRFLDQNALSEFSVGLTSVKSLYLLIRGAGELDATISMPSELIIQYGYVPGFVMSFAILAIARYLAASLMKSNQIFYFAFGYSIVTQILQLERSIQGVFINSIKAAAIVIIISCASLKLVGFKRAIADFGRRQ